MNCKDCGATVERTDRYCPACGTPNAHTRFHPKFGPVPNGFEAEILYEVAPADAPVCLRCERPITGRMTWCQGCGLDLAESWSRHHHRQAVARWERGESVPRPFRQMRRLAGALRLASGLVALVLLGGALGQIGRYGRLQGIAVPGPGGVDLTGPELPARLAAANLVSLVLVVLVAGLLGAWVRGALANLPALGVVDRRRPSWRSWLVPGRLVLGPERAVDDLWRGSTRDLEPCSPTWRRAPSSRLIGLWWGSTLVACGLALLAVLTDPATDLAAQLAAAVGLVGASSLVVLHALVRRIGERQSRRVEVLAEVGPPRPGARRDRLIAPTGRVSVELDASVPTRLAPLEPMPEGHPEDGRRTSALRRQPTGRPPVWGKY